jgi:hypothetical protein
MGVFDIVMEKPAEVSRADGCVWHVFAWLCQAHTSSTDFSRFFNHYIKHTHRFDWLQQVCSWLYQTYPWPRLTSASCSMTITCWSQLKRCVLDIVMQKPGEVSRDDGCVWYSDGKTCWSQLKRCVLGFSMTMSNTHRLDWLQQVYPWLSNIPIASTDFRRFFHDYLVKSVETMGVFDIVMEKPAEVSRGDGCVWYVHGKTCWSYQTHSPLRLTSAGFSMNISNTPIASTDFSKLFHDYIKHTHRLDWLQQVFPWLYQTQSLLKSVEEVCAWHSHAKTLWSQSRRWVCLI